MEPKIHKAEFTVNGRNPHLYNVFRRQLQEADRLRAQIIECNDSITYYENLNRLLRTDPETMERIVREQYHMQRQNEDIYIVE